jgi:O-antigen/teichoic acid export membrane protein
VIHRSARNLFGNKNPAVALLLRGTGSSFFLKVYYTLITFVTGVALARLLGASEYGLYAYALSWVSLLSVLTALGLNQIIPRYVAHYRQTKEVNRTRGIMQSSSTFLWIASSAIFLIATAITLIVTNHEDTYRSTVLVTAFSLVVINSRNVLYGSLLRGYDYILRSQLPTLLVFPSLFLGIVLLYALWNKSSLSALTALRCNLAAMLVALGTAIYFFRSLLAHTFKRIRPEFENRKWFGSAIFVTMMGAMGVLNANADILMLGSIVHEEAAGIYKVASRGAEIILFLRTAIEAPLSPLIARLQAAESYPELQRILTTAARGSLLFGLPLAIFMIAFGDSFLSLFGEEYSDGRTALAILSLGQLSGILAGSVGPLLVMTGKEKTATLLTLMSTVLNVTLNAVLIPVWGLEGAALATALSTAVFYLLLVRSAWMLVGVDPSVVGRKCALP